jgi:hypothetical protein
MKLEMRVSDQNSLMVERVERRSERLLTARTNLDTKSFADIVNMQ